MRRITLFCLIVGLAIFVVILTQNVSGRHHVQEYGRGVAAHVTSFPTTHVRKDVRIYRNSRVQVLPNGYLVRQRLPIVRASYRLRRKKLLATTRSYKLLRGETYRRNRFGRTKVTVLSGRNRVSRNRVAVVTGRPTVTIRRPTVTVLVSRTRVPVTRRFKLLQKQTFTRNKVTVVTGRPTVKVYVGRSSVPTRRVAVITSRRPTTVITRRYQSRSKVTLVSTRPTVKVLLGRTQTPSLRYRLTGVRRLPHRLVKKQGLTLKRVLAVSGRRTLVTRRRYQGTRRFSALRRRYKLTRRPTVVTKGYQLLRKQSLSKNKVTVVTTRPAVKVFVGRTQVPTVKLRRVWSKRIGTVTPTVLRKRPYKYFVRRLGRTKVSSVRKAAHLYNVPFKRYNGPTIAVYRTVGNKRILVRRGKLSVRKVKPTVVHRYSRVLSHKAVKNRYYSFSTKKPSRILVPNGLLGPTTRRPLVVTRVPYKRVHKLVIKKLRRRKYYHVTNRRPYPVRHFPQHRVLVTKPSRASLTKSVRRRFRYQQTKARQRFVSKLPHRLTVYKLPKKPTVTYRRSRVLVQKVAKNRYYSVSTRKPSKTLLPNGLFGPTTRRPFVVTRVPYKRVHKFAVKKLRRRKYYHVTTRRPYPTYVRMHFPPHRVQVTTPPTPSRVYVTKSVRRRLHYKQTKAFHKFVSRLPQRHVVYQHPKRPTVTYRRWHKIVSRWPHRQPVYQHPKRPTVTYRHSRVVEHKFTKSRYYNSWPRKPSRVVAPHRMLRPAVRRPLVPRRGVVTRVPYKRVHKVVIKKLRRRKYYHVTTRRPYPTYLRSHLLTHTARVTRPPMPSRVYVNKTVRRRSRYKQTKAFHRLVTRLPQKHTVYWHPSRPTVTYRRNRLLVHKAVKNNYYSVNTRKPSRLLVPKRLLALGTPKPLVSRRLVVTRVPYKRVHKVVIQKLRRRKYYHVTARRPYPGRHFLHHKALVTKPSRVYITKSVRRRFHYKQNNVFQRLTTKLPLRRTVYRQPSQMWKLTARTRKPSVVPRRWVGSRVPYNQVHKFAVKTLQRRKYYHVTTRKPYPAFERMYRLPHGVRVTRPPKTSRAYVTKSVRRRLRYKQTKASNRLVSRLPQRQTVYQHPKRPTVTYRRSRVLVRKVIKNRYNSVSTRKPSNIFVPNGLLGPTAGNPFTPSRLVVTHGPYKRVHKVVVKKLRRRKYYHVTTRRPYPTYVRMHFPPHRVQVTTPPTPSRVYVTKSVRRRLHYKQTKAFHKLVSRLPQRHVVYQHPKRPTVTYRHSRVVEHKFTKSRYYNSWPRKPSRVVAPHRMLRPAVRRPLVPRRGVVTRVPYKRVHKVVIKKLRRRKYYHVTTRRPYPTYSQRYLLPHRVHLPKLPARSRLYVTKTVRGRFHYKKTKVLHRYAPKLPLRRTVHQYPVRTSKPTPVHRRPIYRNQPRRHTRLRVHVTKSVRRRFHYKKTKVLHRYAPKLPLRRTVYQYPVRTSKPNPVHRRPIYRNQPRRHTRLRVHVTKSVRRRFHYKKTKVLHRFVAKSPPRQTLYRHPTRTSRLIVRKKVQSKLKVNTESHSGVLQRKGTKIVSVTKVRKQVPPTLVPRITRPTTVKLTHASVRILARELRKKLTKVAQKRLLLPKVTTTLPPVKRLLLKQVLRKYVGRVSVKHRPSTPYPILLIKRPVRPKVVHMPRVVYKHPLHPRIGVRILPSRRLRIGVPILRRRLGPKVAVKPPRFQVHKLPYKSYLSKTKTLIGRKLVHKALKISPVKSVVRKTVDYFRKQMLQKVRKVYIKPFRYSRPYRKQTLVNHPSHVKFVSGSPVRSSQAYNTLPYRKRKTKVLRLLPHYPRIPVTQRTPYKLPKVIVKATKTYKKKARLVKLTRIRKYKKPYQRTLDRRVNVHIKPTHPTTKTRSRVYSQPSKKRVHMRYPVYVRPSPKVRVYKARHALRVKTTVTYKKRTVVSRKNGYSRYKKPHRIFTTKARLPPSRHVSQHVPALYGNYYRGLYRYGSHYPYWPKQGLYRRLYYPTMYKKPVYPYYSRRPTPATHRKPDYPTRPFVRQGVLYRKPPYTYKYYGRYPHYLQQHSAVYRKPVKYRKPSKYNRYYKRPAQPVHKRPHPVYRKPTVPPHTQAGPSRSYKKVVTSAAHVQRKSKRVYSETSPTRRVVYKKAVTSSASAKTISKEAYKEYPVAKSSELVSRIFNFTRQRYELTPGFFVTETSNVVVSTVTPRSDQPTRSPTPKHVVKRVKVVNKVVKETAKKSSKLIVNTKQGPSVYKEQQLVEIRRSGRLTSSTSRPPALAVARPSLVPRSRFKFVPVWPTTVSVPVLPLAYKLKQRLGSYRRRVYLRQSKRVKAHRQTVVRVVQSTTPASTVVVTKKLVAKKVLRKKTISVTTVPPRTLPSKSSLPLWMPRIVVRTTPAVLVTSTSLPRYHTTSLPSLITVPPTPAIVVSKRPTLRLLLVPTTPILLPNLTSTLPPPLAVVPHTTRPKTRLSTLPTVRVFPTVPAVPVAVRGVTRASLRIRRPPTFSSFVRQTVARYMSKTLKKRLQTAVSTRPPLSTATIRTHLPGWLSHIIKRKPSVTLNVSPTKAVRTTVSPIPFASKLPRWITNVIKKRRKITTRVSLTTRASLRSTYPTVPARIYSTLPPLPNFLRRLVKKKRTRFSSRTTYATRSTVRPLLVQTTHTTPSPRVFSTLPPLPGFLRKVIKTRINRVYTRTRNVTKSTVRPLLSPVQFVRSPSPEVFSTLLPLPGFLRKVIKTRKNRVYTRTRNVTKSTIRPLLSPVQFVRSPSPEVFSSLSLLPSFLRKVIKTKKRPMSVQSTVPPIQSPSSLLPFTVSSTVLSGLRPNSALPSLPPNFEKDNFEFPPLRSPFSPVLSSPLKSASQTASTSLMTEDQSFDTFSVPPSLVSPSPTPFSFLSSSTPSNPFSFSPPNVPPTPFSFLPSSTPPTPFSFSPPNVPPTPFSFLPSSTPPTPFSFLPSTTPRTPVFPTSEPPLSANLGSFLSGLRAANLFGRPSSSNRLDYRSRKKKSFAEVSADFNRQFLFRAVG